MKQSDQDLKSQSKRNAAAFKNRYQQWVVPVYRYFLYLVRNTKEAEDLTSQVFLKVLEQLPNYTENGHFPAWLFTIVRHQSADYFRSHKPTVPLEKIEVSADLPPLLDHAAQADELARLDRLLRSLPEAEQELIRLRFVAALSYREMAIVLKRDKDAIRKQVSRLLSRLQAQLEEDHV